MTVCHEREKAQQHTNFSVCHDEAWKAYRLFFANRWEDLAFVALVGKP